MDRKAGNLMDRPSDPAPVMDDPWDVIRVIRRLDVGPPRIERKRLIAPYRIDTGAGIDETEFIYRFSTDVFEPGDPESVNLASMMAAQVALNYGLFCDEIVFRGSFGNADRRFLTDALENTAREIVVNKFLEPNPFLIGPAARLPAARRSRYSRATVRFVDEPEGAGSSRARLEWKPWSNDVDRCAILSSGGKESLLSLGLLRESGATTFPFFVNESGRHWLTALNAYRHLSEHHPGTDRVWTNSDRLFTWFLRHLPFIRKDFADVRSDEYPIRLWTVAVYLFGALPLLRKHRVGRLVIGDEFDTTRRATHKGIPHYDGLYDQSRYFDRALTRYFRRKGWQVEQFSLLRPVSELMVQKILADRYPDLFEQQVSCHAAHTEGGRIRPCGRCEKCRRIVAMLVAVGGDPARCGYTEAQVARCMSEFSAKGVHQEKAGAQHLAHLLADKGLLPPESKGLPEPRQRPEIEQLRFDPDRSPPDSIPPDLRQPIYRMLLEHAGGAISREGTHWVAYDPLRTLPRGARQATGRPKGEPRVDSCRLGDLTWPEAGKYLETMDVALLPVGSIEQHGPHLPLDTDAFDAEYLALEVAKACSSPRPLVFPLIPYGVSYHHRDFKGTVDVSPDSLASMVYDVGMSAARNGIAKLVIINGHGGNDPALNFAAQKINRDAHIFTCVDTGQTSDADIEALTETHNDVHAGEIETSTSLAIRPDLVRMDKIRRFVPRFSSRYLDFSSSRSVNWYARTVKLSSSGVLGDPTKATREKGEKMWAVMIKNLVELVEHIKGLSLKDIYQTRY
jgi:creatinine amidohydrolase/Fe(II)-dependent formamide hydrolase-like protein